MATTSNYVVLVNGVPKSLKFSRLLYESREVKDPSTQLPKTVKALIGIVIQEDGITKSTIFSTISQKLQKQLDPYLGDPVLNTRTFTITQNGSGYLTEYSLRVS